MIEAPVNIKDLLPNKKWSIALRWVGKPASLPYVSGKYILLMHLEDDASIRVSKRKINDYKKGYYFYIGSTEGSSGLAYKVGRHWLHKQTSDTSPTVDYLLQQMTVCGVWVIPDSDGELTKCEVAQAFEVSKCEPIQDSSCAQCNCKSHLFHLKN